MLGFVILGWGRDLNREPEAQLLVRCLRGSPNVVIPDISGEAKKCPWLGP